MSYGIESKKLKRLVDFYSPFNCGEELKFLTLFRGQQGLLRYLETSPFQGVDSTSLAERAAWFGTNDPPKPQSLNLRQIILSCFDHFCMKIYLFFSILAVALGFIAKHVEPFAYLGGIFNLAMFMLVLVGLLIVSVFKSYENKKLKDYMFNGCQMKVWRDNERKEIHSFELVIGDVVELQKGDIVGADGIMIDGNLTVKQPLSYKEIVVEKCNTKQCLRRWGEFEDKITKFCLDEIQQQQRMPSPIILGGSQIMEGDGRFVVLCVGKYSRIGNFVNQVHQAACTRQSELSKKIQALTFEISKYLCLAMVIMIILYAGKILAFIIIEKSFVNQDWQKICIDLGRGLTIILVGVPVLQLIGLAMGMFYMRYNIYQTDNIWYKYLKDCGAMKQITAVAFDKIETEKPMRLVKWWNQQIHMIQTTSDNQIISEDNSASNCSQKINRKFQSMLIESLKSKDFLPSEVGLKIHSFFLGMNKRFVDSLEECLANYAQYLTNREQNYPHQNLTQIGIEIEDSKQSILRQDNPHIETVYIKGNSETILKECTHIMNPHSGKFYSITVERRQRIKQIIYQMNSSQEPSLITGFIEVHPNHPKFREPGYKVVMLSLVAYKQSHDNLQFQSLAKMKKMGITLSLVGNREHDEAISMGKEMGLILVDKPSIQLTGYDFHKVVGGIICKSCKKTVCTCTNISKYERVLKNQDQFNRINKHLNVLSQANSHQKLALALGFSYAQERLLFLGTSISDVPAMRVSSISAAVRSQLQDDYTESAAEIILPDNKLVTIEKLINWSYFYCQFCKKYINFTVTPCLVAFVSNFICFILYDTFCVQLIQFVWVSVVIFPLLGFTFAMGSPPVVQASSKKSENLSLIDRISSRQMSSQVITQVCLILIVLIFGPTFIPEEMDRIDEIIGSNWSAKYNRLDKLTVCSGIYNSIFNNRVQTYTLVISQYGIYSRHMTFIFNLFVLMQFVNYLNCRSSNSNSHNFLEGITWTSGIGILLALGLQILIIFQGSHIMELYPYGLTIKQWAICASMSLVVVLVGMLVKQLPYDHDGEEQKGKIWPNRCYNLAVMATAPKENLQDFQIDQQLEVKKMAMHME